jgi:hypothetical protein
MRLQPTEPCDGIAASSGDVRKRVQTLTLFAIHAGTMRQRIRLTIIAPALLAVLLTAVAAAYEVVVGFPRQVDGRWVRRATTWYGYSLALPIPYVRGEMSLVLHPPRRPARAARAARLSTPQQTLCLAGGVSRRPPRRHCDAMERARRKDERGVLLRRARGGMGDLSRWAVALLERADPR